MKPVTMLTRQSEQHYLISGNGGYGFIAKLDDMVGRMRAGEVVMTVDDGEIALPLIVVYASSLINPGRRAVLVNSDYRLLMFPIGELKVMPKGRSLQLVSLTNGAPLEHTAMISSVEFTVGTIDRRDAVCQERLRIRDVDGKRSKKGKVLEIPGRLRRLSGTGSV